MPRLNILYLESDDIHADQVIKLAVKHHNFCLSSSLVDFSRWLDEKKFDAIVADFFQNELHFEELFEQVLSRAIKCPIIIYSTAKKDFLIPYIQDYLMAKEAAPILFASKFNPIQLIEKLDFLKKRYRCSNGKKSYNNEK